MSWHPNKRKAVTEFLANTLKEESRSQESATNFEVPVCKKRKIYNVLVF
jgi:hypothetical protein